MWVPLPTKLVAGPLWLKLPLTKSMPAVSRPDSSPPPKLALPFTSTVSLAWFIAR